MERAESVRERERATERERERERETERERERERERDRERETERERDRAVKDENSPILRQTYLKKYIKAGKKDKKTGKV